MRQGELGFWGRGFWGLRGDLLSRGASCALSWRWVAEVLRIQNLASGIYALPSFFSHVEHEPARESYSYLFSEEEYQG